jgi:hypothetical protein
MLGAIFATNANAQTEIDMRGCLTIEDQSKERLDRMGVSSRQIETKSASCEGGRRLQIPERGRRAVGLL